MDVSVIVPTLNEGKYIEDCLKSIKRQKTGTPFELIVCDGKSEDATKAIAKKYADHVVTSPKRSTGLQRDKGAAKAKGTYLLFVDADTRLPEDYIEWGVRKFREDPKLVACSASFIFTKPTPKLSFAAKTTNAYLEFKEKIGRPTIPGFNFFVKKNVLTELGGFGDIPLEDIDLSFRLRSKGKVRYFTDKVVETSSRRLERMGLVRSVQYYLEMDLSRMSPRLSELLTYNDYVGCRFDESSLKDELSQVVSSRKPDFRLDVVAGYVDKSVKALGGKTMEKISRVSRSLAEIHSKLTIDADTVSRAVQLVKEKTVRRLYIRVPSSSAESIRRKLSELRLLDRNREIVRKVKYILLPVTSSVSIPDTKIVEMNGKEKPAKPRSLAEACAGKLSPEELTILPSSFDLIGDIAVIELPDRLLPRKSVIGECLLNTFKNIKVAAVKAGAVSSEYRTRQIEVVAGEQHTETVHREYGCSYKLDVASAYFSPRLGTERMRVASQVSPGERVLVLFAGVGPYAILIAKKRKPSEVVAVELNPKACEYTQENVRKNKVDVKVICGDARTETGKLGKFDRIVMPLPKDAGDFLDVALPALKPGGVIHFYSFARDTAEAEKIVNEKTEKLGYKTKILNSVECGSYSPCLSRMCVDFKFL
jgi:tRNA (guanine37-N1)-methyltransferase